MRTYERRNTENRNKNNIYDIHLPESQYTLMIINITKYLYSNICLVYMYKQTYLILKPLDINLNWDLQMCIAEPNILFIT